MQVYKEEDKHLSINSFKTFTIYYCILKQKRRIQVYQRKEC